jgi:hypothetical protein
MILEMPTAYGIPAGLRRGGEATGCIQREAPRRLLMSQLSREQTRAKLVLRGCTVLHDFQAVDSTCPGRRAGPRGRAEHGPVEGVARRTWETVTPSVQTPGQGVPGPSASGPTISPHIPAAPVTMTLPYAHWDVDCAMLTEEACAGVLLSHATGVSPHARASNNALASLRSAVSNPSVNQW